MEKYSVKALSKLAGVSARTLHYYDQIGLLKPFIRTEAKYRFYGREQLVRLQQILFYKELDFSLQEIGDILDDPEFDLLSALKNHKTALKERRQRIDTLIETINKTIHYQFKNQKTMLKPEELYDGLPKETAKAYRKEAIKKYGKQAVETSEKSLMKLTKKQIEDLKQEQKQVFSDLFALRNKGISSNQVQEAISRHYINTRQFWGTHGSSDRQLDQYLGLSRLYKADERFTMVDNLPQPEFAKFLCDAIHHFTKHELS